MTDKMSDKAFAKLPRYSNGRLHDLMGTYHLLTQGQVEQLHVADRSYYRELLEEEKILEKDELSYYR